MLPWFTCGPARSHAGSAGSLGSHLGSCGSIGSRGYLTVSLKVAYYSFSETQ